MLNPHSLLLCVSLVSCAQPSPPPDHTARASEHFLERDRVRCHVFERAANPNRDRHRTLVFLPSATYSVRPNWDLQVPGHSIVDAFADAGWTVVSIDLPGYGQADDPAMPETFGAERASRWVHAVVEHLHKIRGIGAIDLIGWSWGAQVAGCYAQAHPDRVRSLVLYGFTPAQRLPDSALPEGPFRPVERAGARSDFLPGIAGDPVVEAYATACVEHDDRVPSGPIRDFVERLPLVDPTKLSMPTLVISGQFEVERHESIEGDYRDFFAERRTGLEAFCRRLPTGVDTPHLVPGGGHAVHLERPTAWREAVRTFLESN